MIEQLFEDAKITDDGVNIGFELNGFKFRFLKVGRGLMRKRRQASSIFSIGGNPDEAELDAINAFMLGFSISKGEEKYLISDTFTLDDFFEKVPEVEDGKAVQLEMMSSAHITAAMAILGNEQAKALLEKYETSDSTKLAAD